MSGAPGGLTPVAAFPIFDGHNDTLLDLHRRRGGGRSFFVESQRGHIDLPRARRGGLGGGFCAVFVPPVPTARPPADLTSPPGDDEDRWELGLAPPIDHSYALSYSLAVSAQLLRLEAENPRAVRLVTDAASLADCLQQGIFAAVLHFEGAEAIDPQLDALEILYRGGLRSLGLVWSRPNAFGHGTPFAFPADPDQGPGLTGAGKALVHACNRLGVMVDLSHLNARGFWDVARQTSAPLVATHSSIHALCPAARNLTDRQLDAIGESGGVVGINFHVSFLRADGRLDADTPLETLADHIDYGVERMGIDHVALGSDFDGATVPRSLKDVTGLPRLVGVLRQRGYDDAALAKVMRDNWLRVLAATWRA